MKERRLMRKNVMEDSEDKEDKRKSEERKTPDEKNCNGRPGRQRR